MSGSRSYNMVRSKPTPHPASILTSTAVALVPTGRFPTQLKQAVLAIQHLISTGVQPHNLYLAGDSAGGNLALMVLSHILHPASNVSPLTLSAPLGGAYLMSPWVSLSGRTGSIITNDSSDIIGVRSLPYWGSIVLDGVPEVHRLYIEAYRAPDAWFKDINSVVKRLLITAGDAEALRDEIVVVADRLCRQHDDAQFKLQKYGVHNDPFFDFTFRGMKKGDLTPVILKWFSTGFL